MAGFITERLTSLSPLQRLRNETNYDEPKAKSDAKNFWFYDAGEVEFFTKVREKSIGAKSK